jgi:pimeloyl-ACP methyl ester carboxylesterase
MHAPLTAGPLTAAPIAGFPALRSDGRTDRPPVVFIHGAFVTHESFAPWQRVFAARGWRTVSASRRGRLGLAPDRCEGVTIADYVDDTLKVIDALGESPILVGHSLGGLIAQKIAELGRCRAAALISPAPPAMLPAQAVAFPSLVPMFPRILAGKPVFPSGNTCSTIVLNRVPESDRPRMHGALVHESGRAYREMIFGTFRVDASKVRCPIHVWSGAHDRIISPALAASTAKRYNAPVRIYDQHAHWLLEEPGWETVAGDVEEWVAT